MFKTYNKEMLKESIKILDDLAGKWAIKTIFWTLATGFAIVKLVNVTGNYGEAAGRRDAVQIIMDDIKENEDN